MNAGRNLCVICEGLPNAKETVAVIWLSKKIAKEIPAFQPAGVTQFLLHHASAKAEAPF